MRKAKATTILGLIRDALGEMESVRYLCEKNEPPVKAAVETCKDIERKLQDLEAFFKAVEKAALD